MLCAFVIFELYMIKAEEYELLQKQVEAITGDETDVIANMANISALLFENLNDVNWVGFYRVISQELVLGPFQGKVACIRIPLDKGVCGTAVTEEKTMRIANVHHFSGHIACDANSNSEIVIPLRVNSKIIAVLDIDSPIHDRFDEDDQTGLENIINAFQNIIIKHGVLN